MLASARLMSCSCLTPIINQTSSHLEIRESEIRESEIRESEIRESEMRESEMRQCSGGCSEGSSNSSPESKISDISANIDPNIDRKLHRKLKFRDAEPTLVSSEDFELLCRFLSLRKKCFGLCSFENSKNPFVSRHPCLPKHPCDCWSSIRDSQDKSQDKCRASQDKSQDSITADFISWLDSSMASSPHVFPPILSFAGEEKGQPVTVVFFHRGQPSNQTSSQALSQPQCEPSKFHPSLLLNDASVSKHENPLDPPQQILTTNEEASTSTKSSSTTTKDASKNDALMENVLNANVLKESLWRDNSIHSSLESSLYSSLSSCLPSCFNAVMAERQLSQIEDVRVSKVTLKFSAGVCLIRHRRVLHEIDNSRPRNSRPCIIPEVLVIRRHGEEFHELPKGHLEKGETLQQAAHRELLEETGIRSIVEIGSLLLSERYIVRRSATDRLEKAVHYFRASLKNERDIGDSLKHDSLKYNSMKYGREKEASGGISCGGISCGGISLEGREGHSFNHLGITPDHACNTVADNAGISCNQVWCNVCCNEVEFGQREEATQHLLWIDLEQARNAFWKSDAVRAVVLKALGEVV